ncbi:hypothetical protein SDC9_180398 [bioreactor metagenome]|uniref:Uncharacterized protein n=1 Tax=bioreactor metagenome TaxID=1076179 RepID=A0A645H1L3_9ZZZZ
MAALLRRAGDTLAVEIHVVERDRTVPGHFAQREERAPVGAFVVQLVLGRKNLLVQPVLQVHVVCEGTHQVHHDMGVRVHESRHHNVMVRVHDPVGREGGAALPHVFDDPILDVDLPVLNNIACFVQRYDGCVHDLTVHFSAPKRYSLCFSVRVSTAAPMAASFLMATL